MNILIIEDEQTAVDNLTYLLRYVRPHYNVIEVIDNVQDSIVYLRKNLDIALIFMDIHLADGISFEIFDKVKITIPIIFTTAYDQYAIRAFKVYSIDYLLKPLEVEEIEVAIQKFEESNNIEESAAQLQSVLRDLHLKKSTYKHTYLVQQRDQLIPLKVSDIAYFIIEASMVKAYTFENKGYLVDKKLEDIELELGPSNFFRVTRQMIIQRSAIESLQVYFQGKLILHVKPRWQEQIIVSKAKSKELKIWIKESTAD